MTISTLISIFGCTQQEYADQVVAVLGRGSQHARICYREFMREGKLLGTNPAFNNCPQLLEAIREITDWSPPPVIGHQQEGETHKFLLEVDNGLEVEAVSIPMQAGGTLCISSQVGCRLGCRFCETGRMGLLKNLSATEIIAQVWVAKHQLNCEVRNIVFMGMGEPLDNYDNVTQAIRVLKDPGGLGYGRQHLTLSTSGEVEGVKRLMGESDLAINLALSLNAPNDVIRNKLMPVNKRHPMEELHALVKGYNRQTGRAVLTAYVLIEGINDSLEHANELIQFIEGLDVKINLIPYNPQSKHGFQPPPQEQIDAFCAFLREKGVQTLLRQTKGRNIMAACGQLGNLELRKRKGS